MLTLSSDINSIVSYSNNVKEMFSYLEVVNTHPIREATVSGPG